MTHARARPRADVTMGILNPSPTHARALPRDDVTMGGRDLATPVPQLPSADGRGVEILGVSPAAAKLPGKGVSPAAAAAYETRAPLLLPGKGVSPVTANLLAGWLWPGRLKRRQHAKAGGEARRVGGCRALLNPLVGSATSRWPPDRA